MDVIIQKHGQIAPVALRKAGYAPYVNKEGEQSFVKRVEGHDFPRFHLYIKEEDDKNLRCSLHLDQTKPSYMGTKAHGGDYDSDVVMSEADRLKST